jgi:hypothetical protein
MKAWHFVGDTLRDGRPVPDDGVLTELRQQRLHGRVIRSLCAPLAHVACGARQRHILDRCLSASRRRDYMVKVEHAPIAFKELKDAALGNLSLRRSESAVRTDSLVSLGYRVPDAGRDISCV